MQDSARRLEDAGDRVRDAAHEAATSSWANVQELLALQPLREFGLSVSVGGVVAALLALLVALAVSLLAQRALRRYGKRHANANQAALYTVSRLPFSLLLVVGVGLVLIAMGSGLLSLGVLKKSQPADLLR